MAPKGNGVSDETTGIEWSSDNMFMYFAERGLSDVIKVWREDGYSFKDQFAGIVYHAG